MSDQLGRTDLHYAALGNDAAAAQVALTAGADPNMADRAGVTAAAVRLPLAAAWADRGVAAVALHSGETTRAVERALASA
jgi:hypothetical protein